MALLQELVFESMPEGAVWPFDRQYIRPPHFHGQLEGLPDSAPTSADYDWIRVYNWVPATP